VIFHATFFGNSFIFVHIQISLHNWFLNLFSASMGYNLKVAEGIPPINIPPYSAEEDADNKKVKPIINPLPN
jgi:hypothetical protein